MATNEDGKRKRKSKKLQKRHPAFQYPQRFDIGDDAEDDVASVDVHLTQSILPFIAASGSTGDLHSHNNGDDSSESDGEERDLTGPPSADRSTSVVDSNTKPQDDNKTAQSIHFSSARSKHDAPSRRPESKLLRSLPKLNIRSPRDKHYLAQSMIFPPRDSSPSSPHGATPRDAPVLSQILEAQARMEEMDDDKKLDGAIVNVSEATEEDQTKPSLEKALMKIFNLKEEEEVVAEYSCWLMQSILLQGYMYLTTGHLCYFAYLPKKSNTVAKSGYLAKRGKSTRGYTRFFAILQGDVLSYFTDPKERYFPSGTVDLRSAISAALDKKDSSYFTLTTHTRVYHFKADSALSAKEWVKTLQKVIFRGHNEGDSVKICIPLAHVVDIEESPVLEWADTIKVRAIDNDETYAVDEYYFSFFSFGKDALAVLKSLTDESPASKLSAGLLSPQHAVSGSTSPVPEKSDQAVSPGHHLTDVVKTTLSPIVPPLSGRSSARASGEWSRKSFDGRRGEHNPDVERISFDHHKIFPHDERRDASIGPVESANKTGESKQSEDFSDSYVQSLNQSDTSDTTSVNDDASASQILSRSDVFHSPTISRFSASPDRAASFDKQKRRNSGRDNSLASPTSTLNDDLPAAGDAKITPRASSELPTSLQPQASSGLQSLMGTPLSMKAAGLAGFIRRKSGKMGNFISSEPMNYVGKVSGMLSGNRKHYGSSQPVLGDEDEDLNDLDEDDVHASRFRAHFSLPPSEKLSATFYGHLYRVLPLYGKLYIGDRHFCYRSLLIGTRTKLILPLAHIENISKERGFTSLQYGLVIKIRGFEEIFFEFSSSDDRDDCAITLLHGMETVRQLEGDEETVPASDLIDAETAKKEHKLLQQARHGANDMQIALPKEDDDNIKPEANDQSITFDDPRASILNFKPTESLRITCLTIGSRGDVQPYIALAKGLLAEGHKVKIATHAEFEPWIREHGIDFAVVDGNPAELMRICVEHGMFTYSFLKEASSKFRGWIDDLLKSAWKACQDSDLLIESPSAMAGIHIAEALEIPYFRAFGMPWTRTRAYPHAFAVPNKRKGGAYNHLSYVLFDALFWTGISGQVNRWRKSDLKLRETTLERLHANKVPFLYNFSPSVVPPPLDYSDWVRVTGYWFLDEGGSEWTPPEELVAFIKKARDDHKKLVYIGFGSIVVSDPMAMTKTVIDSVLKADVRCILSKGWSDRLGGTDSSKTEVPLPKDIHQIKSAPHDWLFKQIDAAVHHGGAGTTGASLRAGLPTVVKPFFGDQYFFGNRVEDLGVGICMQKLNVSSFSRALWESTRSDRMIEKAKLLGEAIRKEDGVRTAIQAIYRDLEYAKTLIRRKTHAEGQPEATVEADVIGEESWTFIGDESDPELIRNIIDWEPMTRSRSMRRNLGNQSPVTPKTEQREDRLASISKPRPSVSEFDDADDEHGTEQGARRTSTRFRSPMRLFRKT